MAQRTNYGSNKYTCNRRTVGPSVLSVVCVISNTQYAVKGKVGDQLFPERLVLLFPVTMKSPAISHTFLEDIWGGARRGLLRSSSLSQLALRGT
jgi:hypothetical protein